MCRSMLVLGAVFGLASCGQAADEAPANTAAANAAEPANKKPTYCFFKNADTRAWAASRDASGDVTVKGEARIADRRYAAALGDSEIEGDKARLWLTMAPNTTGSGAPGDWWQISATVPASGAVKNVTVLCGKKAVAELALKKG